MPQFDISAYPAQLIWLLMCFLGLWGAMQWIIIPLIDKVHTLRQKTLQALIDEARALQEQAAILMQADREMIENAQQKAREIMKKATDQSQASYQQCCQQSDIALQKKLEEIQHCLDTEKANVLQQAHEIAQPLSQLFLSDQVLQKKRPRRSA